jgi:catechol 2,3-dioxygenase-like lactoylglutathione lyase family enzyme
MHAKPKPRNILGIDHPLILVKDLEAARATYAALGFTPTPPGRHPWGTSNVLLMLDEGLLELMSVYDASLIDMQPVGGFAFGRYQHERLTEREGMSLVALHSTDAEKDRARVEAFGAICQGRVDFRRAVKLPDGTTDEAVVTLQILHDPALPRVSHFICHQHKPQYVWVPDWMAHPNGAFAFESVTYCADDPSVVAQRLARLYGLDAVTAITGGYRIETGKGFFLALSKEECRARFEHPPQAVLDDRTPGGIAVAIRVRDLATARACVDAAGMPHGVTGNRLECLDATRLGNIVLELVEG